MKRKIAVTRKPRKCPKCGCYVIARIVCSYPDYNAEIEKDIADGRLRLGGCCHDSCAPYTGNAATVNVCFTESEMFQKTAILIIKT